MGLQENSEISVYVMRVRDQWVLQEALEGGPGAVSCDLSLVLADG